MNITGINKLNQQNQVELSKKNLKDEQFNELLKEKKIDPVDARTKEPIAANGKGRVIGRWALISTGFQRGKIVSMKYADTSTDEDPIMTTVEGGEMIHINSVDPNNATELEMRMYCAHLDATGRGNGGTFGTYAALSMSRLSEFIEQGGELKNFVPTENELKTTNFNWEKMAKKYLAYIHPSDKKQYKKLEMVYDEMQKKIKKNNEKLNINTYC